MGIVTDFVTSVAQAEGAAALEGAIVLVAMDRPLDKVIQTAMGLDCYHPGHPSPWSHCFLIAEPLNSADPATTRILDCTIRDNDANHTIKWDQPNLAEIIKVITNHAGRVYDASDGIKLGDYDDIGKNRVHPVGVKLIETLTMPERAAIVAAGSALKNEGTHYDFLGLLRVLFEFLLHIQLPPDASYFCSAFCQEAYRRALGGKGDFKIGVDSHDVSPDDIWYSATGRRYPPNIPPPSLESVRTFATSSPY